MIQLLKIIQNGFKDRFYIVDFPKEFSKKNKNRDVNLIEKLSSKENLEYIAFKAIKYFARVLRTQEFTEPKRVLERTKQYMSNNDPVGMFLQDFPEYLEVETPRSTMREHYNQWADSNDMPNLEKAQFGTAIHAHKFKDGRFSTRGRERTYKGPNYDKNKMWNPNISMCDMCEYKIMCTDLSLPPEALEELLKEEQSSKTDTENKQFLLFLVLVILLGIAKFIYII